MNDRTGLRTVIPENVEKIIADQMVAIEEEQKREKAARERETQELIATGKAQYDTFILQSLSKVDEWLRPYLVSQDIDFERIGRGWDRAELKHLHFSIPGLAGIGFNPEKEVYYSQSAFWQEYDYDGNLAEPSLTFRNSGSSNCLEDVLVDARNEFLAHQKNMADYEQRLAERRERYASQEKAEAEREQARAIENDIEDRKARTEEQALLDAIKDDPILVQLIKTFILVREERSRFESRIYEADETMYSMEERWSRRAADLRRQADDAQRRADDEKYRLQSDLDDAEEQLKKAKQQAQHGW